MEKITYRKTLDVHKNGIQFTLQGFETADNMSRVIEISLMASGDTVDFPLEQIEAMMYVTTPSATEPSINACTIKDNKVVYEVLPIAEEGITTMQVKIIGTSLDGATSVLCSPKFAVEVEASGADDGEAEQTTTFTALENAVARAELVYNKRVERIDVEPDGIFKVYYADGVVYESDAFQKLIATEGTDIDWHSVISEVMTKFTIEELVEHLDGRYRDIFAKAEKSSNLFANYDKPTFVQWNSSTENTPYTARLVSRSEGFALVFGSVTADHIVIAWSIGSKAHSHIHKFVMGVDVGWDSYITASGGNMTGPLGLGGGKGSVSADAEGAFIEANTKQIKVKDASLEESAKLVSNVNGIKTEYNLFGEHNPDKMEEAGYVRIKRSTYIGDGEGKTTITFDVEPMVFILDGFICAVRGTACISVPLTGSYNTSVNLTWGEKSLELDWSNEYVHYLNVEGQTYRYSILY